MKYGLSLSMVFVSCASLVAMEKQVALIDPETDVLAATALFMARAEKDTETVKRLEAEQQQLEATKRKALQEQAAAIKSLIQRLPGKEAHVTNLQTRINTVKAQELTLAQDSEKLNKQLAKNIEEATKLAEQKNTWESELSKLSEEIKSIKAQIQSAPSAPEQAKNTGWFSWLF